MKHFFKANTLLLLVLLISASVSAQTLLQENFTKATIPTGWAATTANGQGWKISKTSTYSSNTVFAPVRNGNFAGICDEICNCSNDSDILKTIPINMKGASSAFLSFQSYFLGGYLSANPSIGETARVIISPDGGTTWTSTINVPVDTIYGWENMYFDISGFAGDSNVVIGFLYKDSSQVMFGWGVDSVNVFVPSTSDLSINSPIPVAGSYGDYFGTGSTSNIGFSIFNNSSSTVNTFSASYSVDGGAPVTQTFNGLSIPPYYNYFNVVFTTPYNVTTTGTHNIQIVVNEAGDTNLKNDTAKTYLTGVPFMPHHNMVFEEATGTWCGWCPRGIVFMDSITKTYPGNPTIINVHDNDPMEIPAYDAGEVNTMNALLGHTYFPNIIIDRKDIFDPMYAFFGYQFHINDFGFADLNATQLYDPSTRISTINVTTNFAIDMSHAMRLACIYTEDSVHNDTSNIGFDQNNYYSSSFGSQMHLQGAGINWYVDTDPVAAYEMYFSEVARAIVGGYTGQSGSLPGTIKASNPYNYTFTYTIPSAYNEKNMKVTVLLIDATSNVILNSTSPMAINGINDVKSNVLTLSLYPNPATSQLNVLFSLSKPQSVVLEITDIMGRLVYSKPFSNLAPTNQLAQLPINNLASGIYLLNIKTDAGVVSRKFIKD